MSYTIFIKGRDIPMQTTPYNKIFFTSERRANLWLDDRLKRIVNFIKEHIDKCDGLWDVGQILGKPDLLLDTMLMDLPNKLGKPYVKNDDSHFDLIASIRMFYMSIRTIDKTAKVYINRNHMTCPFAVDRCDSPTRFFNKWLQDYLVTNFFLVPMKEITSLKVEDIDFANLDLTNLFANKGFEPAPNQLPFKLAVDIMGHELPFPIYVENAIYAEACKTLFKANHFNF